MVYGVFDRYHVDRKRVVGGNNCVGFDPLLATLHLAAAARSQEEKLFSSHDLARVPLAQPSLCHSTRDRVSLVENLQRPVARDDSSRIRHPVLVSVEPVHHDRREPRDSLHGVKHETNHKRHALSTDHARLSDTAHPQHVPG